MNKEKVKQIVLDIIAEIAPDEDLSEVKPEIRLRDQLDLDSMDFLDIVMELRKQHGIEVPEAEYSPSQSVVDDHVLDLEQINGVNLAPEVQHPVVEVDPLVGDDVPE